MPAHIITSGDLTPTLCFPDREDPDHLRRNDGRWTIVVRVPNVLHGTGAARVKTHIEGPAVLDDFGTLVLVGPLQ